MKTVAPVLRHLLCALLLGLLSPSLFAADAPRAEPASPVGDGGDPISDSWLQRIEQQVWPAPKCLPDCVHIAGVQVSAGSDSGRLTLDVHVQTGNFLLPLPYAAGWLPHTILLDGKPAPVRLDAEGHLQMRVAGGVHKVEMDGRLLDAQWALSFPSAAHAIHYGVLNGWAAQKSALPAQSLTLLRQAKTTAPPGSAEGKQADFPLFARLTRSLLIREKGWSVHSKLERLSPLGFAKETSIDLLPGERPLTPGMEARGGKLTVRLGANETSKEWESTLPPMEMLKFVAAPGFDLAEIWTIDADNRFETSFKGIPQAFGATGAQAVFLPFPGETLELRVSLPKPLEGPDWAIESSRLTLRPGDERMGGSLALSLRSLSAQIQTVEFPKDTRIRALNINRQAEPADWRDGKLYLQLKPGRQDIEIEFETPTPMGLVTRSPTIRLGTASVNAVIEMAIPYSRWPLLSFGPTLGPAVLLWGLLAFLFVAAYGLSRHQPGRTLRLGYWEWLALLAPLCALEAAEALWAVVAVLALQGRERLDADHTRRWVWNLTQIVLGLLTLSFLGILIAGVKTGLLGVPDMMVAGAGSTNWQWVWYQDRQGMDYAQAGMVSLPMWVWRALMLAWSFWIAARLIAWSSAAWRVVSAGGLWRPRERLVR
jgi:hypothetical protein